MRLSKKLIAVGLAVVALIAAVAVGWLAASMSYSGGGASQATLDYQAASSAPAGGAALAPQEAAKSDVSAENASTAGVSADVATRQVIRTASIDLRVDDARTSVAAVRKAATAAGGQVESLSFGAGYGAGGPIPLPAESDPEGPQIATVVVRVPADRLAQLSAKLGALGTVTAESASEQDVTQQSIDLDARLRNLRAEEARLRSFLGKANRVSDMLAIEQELSRVRGDIESMQAQKQYLDDQVAMATLTVTLTEPAAVVSPAGTDWGFSEAVTAGVRAAAAVVQAAITVAIGASPLLLGAFGVWLVVIARRKRRTETAEHAAS